jgi:hypothetical protein
MMIALAKAHGLFASEGRQGSPYYNPSFEIALDFFAKID